MRNGKSTQAALSFLSSFIYLFIHLFIYLFIFLLWTFYGRRCWGSWHGSIFIARHNQRLLKRFFFWGREKKKPEIKMYEIKKMVFFLFLVILGFTLATRSRPVVPLSRWNKLFWKKKERKRWKKMFSEIKKRHHLLASGSLPTVGPPSLPSCTEFFFWLCFFFSFGAVDWDCQRALAGRWAVGTRSMGLLQLITVRTAEWRLAFRDR